MANTLKFGGGTWATKEGSTLAYNDENNNYKPLPFTTTRNSIATRVNKEGLIEVVGNDKPRIDYTDSEDGVLLLENSRTNSLLQSNQFDTTWTTSNATVTSGQIGVGGSSDAWELEKTATNGYIRHIGVNVVDGSISIYAKKGNSNWLRLGSSSGNIEVYFDLQNGVIGNKASLVNTANITEMSNGWYRCSYSYTGTVTGVYLYPADNNGDTSGTSGSVYIQYAQLEQGSYATSYIPTQGSAVTRSADTASGAGNSEVFNDSEGVLFADISAFAGAGGGTRRIEVSNGVSATQYVRLQIANGDGSLYAILNNGSQQFLFNETSFNATLPNKISLKYKQNDFSLFVNGFEVGSSNVGNTFANGVLTQANFSSTASEFYGKTKELGYYDTTLTDEELEYMTSYRSLNELVTELNLKAL